jgi:hemoglobin
MNRTFPFKQEHFDAWLRLFDHTLDEMYAGEKADLAKKRALGIAQLMQLKMSTGSSSISTK